MMLSPLLLQPPGEEQRGRNPAPAEQQQQQRQGSTEPCTRCCSPCPGLSLPAQILCCFPGEFPHSPFCHLWSNRCCIIRSRPSQNSGNHHHGLRSPRFFLSHGVAGNGLPQQHQMCESAHTGHQGDRQTTAGMQRVTDR